MVLDHQYEQSRFVIGDGAVESLGSIVAAEECNRVMIVAGETTGTKSELIDPILESLGDRHACTYTGCKEDVPLLSVTRGIELKHEHDVDGFVSIGGGSNHDTAKAIAELAAEDGGLHEIKARVDANGELVVPDNSASKDPVFTVSTTFTGAEVTNSISVTDLEQDTKTVIIDDRARPTANIYDPTMTRTTPTSILAESGMNAVDHAVEILYSSTLGENPFYQATAEKALPLLLENLPTVVDGSPDTGAITRAHYGACLSAMDITRGYCINHSINHGICAHYPVTHGQGDSILLPHGVRFNFEAVPERIRRIGRAMDVIESGDSNEAALEAVVDRLHRLQDSLGLPRRLGDVADDPSLFEAVADDVIRNPGITHNPRAVTTDDIVEILENAW